MRFSILFHLRNLRILLILLLSLSQLTYSQRPLFRLNKNDSCQFIAPQSGVNVSLESEWRQKSREFVSSKKAAGVPPLENEQLLQFGPSKSFIYIPGGIYAINQLKDKILSSQSKKAIENIVTRIRQIELESDNPLSKKYLDAGWNHIQWDRFTGLVLLMLGSLRSKIEGNSSTYRFYFQDEKGELGFSVDEELPPHWAYTTTVSGVNYIHVTKRMIEKFAAPNSSQETKSFLLQILFHEILEKEFDEILSQFPGVDASTLKHPMAAIFETLLESNEDQLPPLVSISQKQTLLYAMEHDLEGYLRTRLEEDHPLDFKNSFDRVRKKYLFLINIMKKLKENDFQFELSLHKFFQQYIHDRTTLLEAQIETMSFKYRLLEKGMIDEKDWNSLLTMFKLHQYNNDVYDYSKEELVKALLPHLRELLIREVVNVDLNISDQIYFGPLSRAFKLERDNVNIFLKLSRLERHIKYLFYEHDVYEKLVLRAEEKSIQLVDYVDPDGPKIYQSGETFYVGYELEYVENSQTLKSYIVSLIGSELDPEKVLIIVKELLEAMIHLKKNQIVIRDTKPENILVVDEERTIRTKVVDFGLAHIQSQGPFIGTPGTPSYYSPEEVASKINQVPFHYTFDQDLWKLGVTFYNLMNELKFPFRLIDQEEASTAAGSAPRGEVNRLIPILTEPLKEISSNQFLDPRLKALSEIINHMLRYKDIEDRYQGPEQVLEKVLLLESLYKKGKLSILIESDRGAEYWKQITSPKNKSQLDELYLHQVFDTAI